MRANIHVEAERKWRGREAELPGRTPSADICRTSLWILLVMLAACSRDGSGSGNAGTDTSGGGDTSSGVPADGDADGDGDADEDTGRDGDTDGCVVEGPEVCDGKDNDCNGVIDDGVLNACGECGESCDSPTSMDPTGEGVMDSGLIGIGEDDPDNPTGRPGITLSKESSTLPYLWGANHTDNSLFKFNTETHEQEGNYWVGLDPSRTAVDLDGNAWVGGRADGRLTKILWDASSCPDRNGDGVIQTSRIVDGVVTQINSAADPFADECVVYSDIPNPARPSIRGLAVAPDGKMWIGYTDGGIQSIDPVTFDIGTFHDGAAVPLWILDADNILSRTELTAPTGGVYGLVIDSRGWLYQSSYTRNYLPCFDTVEERWIAIFQRGSSSSYGISVDAENRVWTGSWPDGRGVGMFDPDELKFYTFSVPDSAVFTPGGTSPVLLIPGGGGGGMNATDTTGVAADPDSGDIWTSFYQRGYTGRLTINEADYSLSTWTFIGTLLNDTGTAYVPDVFNTDLRGVGFDSAGFVWTLGLASQKIFKIDPSTNARAASLSEGKSVGVGTHYTYSDFTGSTALNFTAPRGFWRHRIPLPFACALIDGLNLEAHVPEGTTLGIRIRALNDSDMPVSGWIPDVPLPMVVDDYFDYAPGTSTLHIDLVPFQSDLEGQRFEVEVRMTTTDRKIRPILHALEIEWKLGPDCVDPVIPVIE